ncbi:hypothetical protein [Zunongwangia sp. HGR-M22]|uniref:hypothetical protein n=1 Tax=Zunongwangia sp. HGR-M22 TaxID=3015168 RepID=UPI0022DD35BF|nr:hypothetical protein [Zunongwangia sp. HGR-M22]WBL25637.1 hypothetical protein PBT91_17300 [Zunongwangia sp. HGR-M22]
MKSAYFIFSIIFFSMFTNCRSHKDLQEEAPAQFQQAYYSSDKGQMTFFLPVIAIQNNRVELKNIYFKGLKSPIVKDEDVQNRYTAIFNVKQSDFVMSSDPKEEYGNKMPQRPVESPIKIEKNQALLEYQEGKEIKYYLLDNIEERK